MSNQITPKLTNIDEIKSLDEFDFDKIELLRGETPEDIREKCLQLCKNYLSANWRQQSVNTIEVRRISGGLTNQLYYCAIAEPSAHPQNVPQEVVIRLYGDKYFNNLDNLGNNLENERLTDVVIGLMVSSNKLGPKIYGVFESGQIHKYYQHRQFTYAEQNDPKLIREVFEKLARIHAMDVPINRSNNWLFSEFDNAIKLVYENEVRKKELADLFNKSNYDLFAEIDLKAEIEWVKELVLKNNSPIVFTHNDFRSSNLMVLENNNNLTKTSDQIVICDYEYSGYGFRGFDFQVIAREWGKPNRDYKAMISPVDPSIIQPLIEIYVSESERIFGKKYSENPINSVDNILKEIKILSLAYLMFVIAFYLKSDHDTGFLSNKKLLVEMTANTIKNYFQSKTQLKEQNLIN